MPGYINIPTHCTGKEKLEEAYKIIGESSALPAVCGRVCPRRASEATSAELQMLLTLSSANWSVRYATGQKKTVSNQFRGRKTATDRVIGSSPAGILPAQEL